MVHQVVSRFTPGVWLKIIDMAERTGKNLSAVIEMAVGEYFVLQESFIPDLDDNTKTSLEGLALLWKVPLIKAAAKVLESYSASLLQLEIEAKSEIRSNFNAAKRLTTS